jgi:hypothetical protein
MAAAAGASGARAWLQAHHFTWLTEQRLKRITIALMVAAFIVPSVGLSSSTKPAHRLAQTAELRAPAR